CSWPLLVRSLYSLTSSLASLGQRNIRRLWTPSASPILLPSGGWVLMAVNVPGPSTHTCLYASGIPPLLLQKRMRRFGSDMLRDEGGGWSLAPHEPSGSREPTSRGKPLSKNFFAAGIRAGGPFRCRKSACVAEPWPKDETC